MSERIDINTADVETLTTISGIGPALAQRIVEYRETVHPFEEVIELAAVPGISEKMVRGFEAWVSVEGVLAEGVLMETAVAHEPNEAEESASASIDIPEALELPEVASVEMKALEPDMDERFAGAEIIEPEEALEDDLIEDYSEEEFPIMEAEVADSEETLAAVVLPSASLAPEPEPEPELELDELDEMEEVPFADDVASEDADEPEEIAPVFEPVQAPPPPPQMPADWESKAQRRGCISTLLGATFGAILGAVLTLAVLAGLNNGSLTYDESNTAVRSQLDTEIISRTTELNQLSTRISVGATAEAAAQESLQADFAEANAAINEELADNDEIISYLATRSGDLELRLQDVAGAADTFTGFLDGLRFLLDDLDGATATPASPSRPTATPSAEDATSIPELTPTPTPTPLSQTTPLPTETAVQPTRTSQPTATPFSFPTSTPAAQP